MNQHLDRRRPVAAYPYHVYLGPSHVVEVKKGGQQIGIYLITPTHRRRGVLLPINIWYILQNSIDIVNLAINFSQGVISSEQYDFGWGSASGQSGWPTRHGAICYTGESANKFEPYIGGDDTTNSIYTSTTNTAPNESIANSLGTLSPTQNTTYPAGDGFIGWSHDTNSFTPKEEAVGFYDFFTTNHPDGEGR
jgi:hypothetical protein